MESLSDYDYDLPESMIASAPMEPRDACKMLVYHRDSGTTHIAQFKDILSELKAGDVVVINQKYKLDELNVGDVIAYKYEGKIIVHRIAKVAKYRDEKIFYTQGDANNTIDEYIVYPETIMGSVKWKIPYIGLPTVWLNEL